jgi:Tfp pilus assembly protein PilV
VNTVNRHPPTAERGETLIELLVTVLIMGVVIVAVVGGIATSILMSDIHRKQATAGAYLRNYAEALQSAVAGGAYIACANPDGHDYATPTGFVVPAGYAATVVAGTLKYWNGTGWQSTCTTDTGLQQLTIQVASADTRASERLMVVIRKPCRLTDTPCG